MTVSRSRSNKDPKSAKDTKPVEEINEQNAKENILARPFKQLAYALSPQRVYLSKEEFCHIADTASGEITLVEGPVRRVLGYYERVVCLEKKVVIPENHYAVILNPSRNGRIQYGQREVRVGPSTFSLYPGEKVEGSYARGKDPHRGGIISQYVLTQYDALLVKALERFSVPGEEQIYDAGDEFLIRGPRTYIPSKHEQIVRTIRAISLSDTDGIYVQNKDTGEVDLIRGPVDYFLKPNEQRWRKETTQDELAGLGLKEQAGRDGVRILTRQAANTSFLHDPSNALVLELEEDEVVLLYDGSDSRIEKGPKTIFVDAYERPKILHLSGGKPIEPGALKVCLLKTGPDFIYDRIKVRTKDNAQIVVDVTYKWRFASHDEAALRAAFSIDDFVGYAAETLSSDIRSVVAKHDFEDLHVNALEYAKRAIFGDNASRIFPENNLEIFAVDITSIVPEDAKIAEKLHEAIKHNMDVYCKKIVLQATLEAERQEVEGRKKIEAERGDLIDAQTQNYRREITERARVDAEARQIEAEAEAEALKIRREAEIALEKNHLDSVIGALSEKGAQVYVDLERARTFQGSEKLVVVPSKSKIVLPLSDAERAENGQNLA